ncbi:hypothetical protein V7654_06440 [Bacillus sp. JJ1609]|uniref:hypothetical protein n=1 Tax=Bacillus sp. JJ1609 TaxID=3122977 RepID=UPI002FFE907E
MIFRFSAFYIAELMISTVELNYSPVRIVFSPVELVFSPVGIVFSPVEVIFLLVAGDWYSRGDLSLSRFL